ncbi:hypothetical protein [Nonomuraea phyllanthi]|nr:hypothetical protein [Nonomuraea phyllanthi]
MIDRPFLRRLARAAMAAAVRGAATAIASAPITLIIWWITHR